MQIITACKRSLGQDNVFTPPGQTPQADTPLQTPPWADTHSDTTGYGQQACGMHPTGMHTCYHPQCSCGKVMFSQASVILSIGGRGCVADPSPRADPQSDTPLGRHPQQTPTPWQTPVQTPPSQTPPSACWDTHTPAQCMLGYTPLYWNAFLYKYEISC